MHSDREQLFPIHKKKEALCSSSIWKRRKFSNCILRWHSGSHAYSVGCYYYICMQGFLRPPNKEVALQSALLYFNNLPCWTDGQKEKRYGTKIITSGPQIPRIGGVIMIKANNREAVDAIISEDPFYINGIADYQIVKFSPTMFANDSLKSFLE